MKLLIPSDLHLEFGKWLRSIGVSAIDAEAPILASDFSEARRYQERP